MDVVDFPQTDKPTSQRIPMPIENKRILITGGAGFIGAALACRLVERNQIVVYDNGHRNSLKDRPILNHPNLEIIWGDVLDAENVRQAVRGCQIIIHMAAIAGVDTVLKMPVTTMKVNFIGTYNVLEAAIQDQCVGRFIDFSTSEVFGTYAYKAREGDVTSLGAVGEARWTYAVSKLATEHLAHNYRKQYGLPTVSVRPFNIYGPGQVGEGAIHHFILRALMTDDLEIHNDGSQIRAWCYIDDFMDGLLLCAEKSAAIGQVFNIGNPRSVLTIYHLAQEVVRLSGSKSKIKLVHWPYTDVELRIPDIEKARQLLGYEPSVDLDDGLIRTIAWYRQKLAA